jgi:hypothetical protein
MRTTWIIVIMAAALGSGCRTATRVIDEGRVDLEMPEGGNRGYLLGTPPPWEGPKSTVRKMVEMEIENPPLWTPAKPPALDNAEALSRGEISPPPTQETAAEVSQDRYTK